MGTGKKLTPAWKEYGWTQSLEQDPPFDGVFTIK